MKGFCGAIGSWRTAINDKILVVDDAHVEFQSPGGVVRALDGVSLSVQPGETLAVVGESGCGKTTLARAILGLQPMVAGRISVLGREVHGISHNQAESVGIVWQDPYASLDPRWRVGKTIVEPLKVLGRKADAAALFETVGLDPKLASRYPHQLSGGQRQRVAIGRALATRPPLVICDEPTAALDLSIRAQILNLLKDIQTSIRCSFLYISHDLMTVRFLADRIAVMYLGRIVEEGPTEDVFSRPRHPYTKALLDSAPTLEKLLHLPDPPSGEIPDPRTKFIGCRYAGRCPNALRICQDVDPPRTQEGERGFYCHNPVSASVQTLEAAGIKE